MNPFRPPRGAPARIPVLAAAPVPVGEGSVQLRLFDPIDSWGGEWGISAKEFVSVLDSLPDTTNEIRLLINSPGGEVYEGLAILNALRAHPAKVVAVVQGIAASAASFIAAGADELVMMKNSELMIHNALAIVVGDAELMREVAADLDRFDRNLASIYAAKSGKTVDEWLALMRQDKFFSAEDAVTVGLADRIEGVADIANATARFDLSVFARFPDPNDLEPRAYGREPQARSQELPSSSEPGASRDEKELDMSDAFMAGVRERLGVTDAEASEETVLTALTERLAAKAENTVPEGAVLIDAGVLAEIRADGEAGRKALETQSKDRREGIVATAVREGRISQANRDKWLASLEKDEDGAVGLLASLEPNRTPVVEIGHQDDIDSVDALYNKAWPADDDTEKEA
jgi:ATP-dependent Clp endopeptidase proteolytic subunit ClpP